MAQLLCALPSRAIQRLGTPETMAYSLPRCYFFGIVFIAALYLF
ncbi:hypothetical protein SAMN05192544_10443 [Paraburkholderia hospita]|jgi:hypothetical protein|nr:hypothetical protein PMI06_008670 [Burkholderia sp. BT03]SEI22580.1 hypothetical protein SAMN05192544_10443 [Paraburkholderia hospita]SKC51228.1 hypothetical protein SAMN06266956_0413 [Paraburkholderia hospita]